MQTLLSNLFRFEAPDSIGTKIQLRAFEFFSVLYCLIYTWEWAFYIPRLSDVVLPLGLAEYMDISIFFSNGISVWNAVLISILSILPFITKKMRWMYLLAFLLFHLQYVARFSQGEIPHSANLIGFSMLGLGLSGVFFKDLKKALPFAFGFVIFWAGLSYTSAAVSKLIATGPMWVDGNHLWLWMGEKKIDILSLNGVFAYNWLQNLAFEHRIIATMILMVGLLTELLGFTIWFKKTRIWITLMLIGMHVGIDLTMNIFFKTFTLQLILMGFPWNHWINRVTALRFRRLTDSVLFRKMMLY